VEEGWLPDGGYEVVAGYLVAMGFMAVIFVIFLFWYNHTIGKMGIEKPKGKVKWGGGRMGINRYIKWWGGGD